MSYALALRHMLEIIPIGVSMDSEASFSCLHQHPQQHLCHRRQLPVLAEMM